MSLFSVYIVAVWGINFTCQEFYSLYFKIYDFSRNAFLFLLTYILLQKFDSETLQLKISL